MDRTNTNDAAGTNGQTFWGLTTDLADEFAEIHIIADLAGGEWARLTLIAGEAAYTPGFYATGAECLEEAIDEADALNTELARI